MRVVPPDWTVSPKGVLKYHSRFSGFAAVSTRVPRENVYAPSGVLAHRTKSHTDVLVARRSMDPHTARPYPSGRMSGPRYAGDATVPEVTAVVDPDFPPKTSDTDWFRVLA